MNMLPIIIISCTTVFALIFFALCPLNITWFIKVEGTERTSHKRRGTRVTRTRGHKPRKRRPIHSALDFEIYDDPEL